jgi:hypothetical protein
MKGIKGRIAGQHLFLLVQGKNETVRDIKEVGRRNLFKKVGGCIKIASFCRGK